MAVNSKLIAVIGLGTFGYILCLELTKKGAKVIAVDREADVLERIKESVFKTVQLDTTDELSLKSLSIENADTVVVAMANDIQSSILTTAILKKMEVSHIIARASSNIHSQILNKIGADEVINLEEEQGKRIATRIISPNLIDQYAVSDNFSFAEIFTPEIFTGKTLPELDLRNKFNVSVVLIKRKDYTIDEFGNSKLKERIVIPDAHEPLTENDLLIVVGENSNIAKIREL